MNSALPPPDISRFLERPPYSLPATEKAAWLGDTLRELTAFHRGRCPEYDRILSLLGEGATEPADASSVPMLPVRLFKEHDLLSVDRSEVFKTMTSSGTSGMQVSRIYLDRDTAALQAKVLARLMTDLLGKVRPPMLVIDSPGIVRDRAAFSARGAGILGFSQFGKDVTYALTSDMNLDTEAIGAFLERNEGRALFLFGFTSIVWRNFYEALIANNLHMPLNGGILLHGGGWKALQAQAVTNDRFRHMLAERTGLTRIVNYYGMVEQTGSIYLECQSGHLHAPIYSDILIRDPVDFSLARPGDVGLIEAVSVIPRSYPGHAVLTEDLGRILGEDDCTCGRLGKYFEVIGRVADAEVRGCSDAYAVSP